MDLEEDYTEKLVHDMLSFLDSSDDEDMENNKKTEPKIYNESDIYYSKWNLWSPISNKLSDPIWRPISISAQQGDNSDWGSCLKQDILRSNCPIVQRQTDFADHPFGAPFNSGGENFQLTRIYESLWQMLGQDMTPPRELVPFVSGYDFGRFPTLTKSEAEILLARGNPGRQSALSNVSGHMDNCNFANIIPPPGVTGTNGIFGGHNRNLPPPPGFHPQPPNLGTNDPANNVGNIAAPPPPGLMYSHRMVRTTYMNNSFSNEAQLLTTGVAPPGYEQWLYAQILQQQMYQQAQRQATALATRFYQMNETNGGPPGYSNSQSSYYGPREPENQQK